MSSDLFAEPRFPSVADCVFYHTMEIPGAGLVGDPGWDLRKGVDDYLGHVDFAGKRVLEIGPASGFLTVEMGKRGAEVVAVEMPSVPGWEYVPFPAPFMAPFIAQRQQGMERMKNGFWFNVVANGSTAKAIYAKLADLPQSLGRFDVALLGSVLLHSATPLQLVADCAARADMLIITDLYFPDLEGKPVMRLQPTAANKDWGTWWQLSPDLLTQFLEVLGFRSITKSVNGNFSCQRSPQRLFTLVASDRTPA